jgi:hypothetical protein
LIALNLQSQTASLTVIRAHITCLCFIFPEPKTREIYNTDRLYEPVLPVESLYNEFVILQSHGSILPVKQQYLQLDSGVKVSVRVLMESCSSRVRRKTILLVFFASLLGKINLLFKKKSLFYCRSCKI